ncbi:MAG: IS66 family transposase [Thermoplasmataceae archaeon]
MKTLTISEDRKKEILAEIRHSDDSRYDHRLHGLLYLGMEPTNNLAEQAIREHVVIRKNLGIFRSEEGTQNYHYI